MGRGPMGSRDDRPPDGGKSYNFACKFTTDCLFVTSLPTLSFLTSFPFNHQYSTALLFQSCFGLGWTWGCSGSGENRAARLKRSIVVREDALSAQKPSDVFV